MSKRTSTATIVFCALTLALGTQPGTESPQARTQAAPVFDVRLPQVRSVNTQWRLTVGAPPGSESQPSFSPDGQTIVYVHTTPQGETDIYTVPISQGVPTRLTNSPDVIEDMPRFMPAGRHIVFGRKTSEAGATWDIYTMTLTGTLASPYYFSGDNNYGPPLTATNELHPFPVKYGLGSPGWQLLYSSDQSGNWDVRSRCYHYTIVCLYSIGPGDEANPAADRFPSMTPDYQKVLFRSDRSGASDIYLWATVSAGWSGYPEVVAPDPAFDGYPLFISDGSGIVFDSDRSGVRHTHMTGWWNVPVRDLAAGDPAVVRDSVVSPDSRWRAYASGPSLTETRLYLSEFESPLYRVAARGKAMLPDGRCDWEAQTLAMAWGMAFQMTRDTRYAEWTRQFVDACAPKRTVYEINDGMIGFAALVAYGYTGQASYLTYARSIGDWMLNTAQRTSDGTLVHAQGSDWVWVDTLLGMPPLLTELSRVTGDGRYLDEAVRQVKLHATHLQDPASGLYHHAWSESQNAMVGPAYWARGNGWAAFGNMLVVTAAYFQRSDEWVAAANKQLFGLAQTQTASGRWHTSIIDGDTYIESSGSGLISFALGFVGKCLHMVDGPDLRHTWLAERSVWQQVAPDGTLQEVQAPTGPRANGLSYNDVPYSEPQLYGQAIAILNGLRWYPRPCTYD